MVYLPVLWKDGEIHVEEIVELHVERQFVSLDCSVLVDHIS